MARIIELQGLMMNSRSKTSSTSLRACGSIGCAREEERLVIGHDRENRTCKFVCHNVGGLR